MLMKTISKRVSAPWGRTRVVIFASVLVACASYANATLIEVDLGPAPKITSQTPLSPFGALNGTPLEGQSASVDFSFSHNEFVRLFTSTSPTFDALVTLQTNGSGFLGFLEGTGYLVDIDGKAIPGFGITGSSSGSDGSMALGLFPLLNDKDGTPNPNLLRPLDFYGIHFDWSFPDVNDPSIHVTGGEFTLISDAPGVFGIGPGIPADVVPDYGSTLFLLGIGLALTAGLRSWRV